MDMINKAFIETMVEGDANGRGFQYPIPTYSITNDFDWSDADRYAQPSYYADDRLDNNGEWYLSFRDGDDGRSASGYRNGDFFGRADCCYGAGNTD